jgi:hypothetical protein
MQLSVPIRISLVLFVIFAIWWTIVFGIFDTHLVQHNLYWAAAYQIVALWGGLFGLYISRLWGGYKSLMGRSIIFFSLGLLLQCLGQSAFSYYTTILGVEVPYPSMADIGYFGSIPFYGLGIAWIAKVSGVAICLRSLVGKTQAFVVPAVMLILSYAFFLWGYKFDLSQPLKIVLDFGYPLGEAIYVSIAILALLLSRNILGGIMKGPIIFLMMALIAQYCADFNFLYQAANDTWINGGYGDFMYLVAYFLMTTALLYLGDMFSKISET